MAATYDPERERRRQEVALERERRVAERDRKAAETAQKVEYLARRKDEATRANAAIERQVEELRTFLVLGLQATHNPDLSIFHRVPKVARLDLGNLGRQVPPPTWETFAPRAPGFWRRTFSASAIQEEQDQARLAFQRALDEHAVSEAIRQRAVIEKQRQHQAAVASAKAFAEQENAKLDDITVRAREREKSAVEEYLLRILSTVPRPKGFPVDAEVTFDSTTENLEIEIELPTPSCVPDIKSMKYVQVRDELVSTARAPRELAELYRLVVAQLCLLVIRTLFNSDSKLKEVSLNGRVRHINPATGHEERPPIISVLVERSRFDTLLLDRVKPGECLKHLRALISSHPYELVPVEPLVDFDKSRLAFIAGLRMVASLDSRPDLMALSPTEFEHLIRELFDADPTIESVESLVTRQSNDGGIDGVIYVRQPLGRSMTAVQVKQYARSRALGPAHVRELIGAMHEAKAGNGLLVTTSSFTVTTQSNAQEFGRIQLIDGNNLVHLIKEHLGKDVLIGDRPRPSQT